MTSRFPGAVGTQLFWADSDNYVTTASKGFGAWQHKSMAIVDEQIAIAEMVCGVVPLLRKPVGDHRTARTSPPVRDAMCGVPIWALDHDAPHKRRAGIFLLQNAPTWHP